MSPGSETPQVPEAEVASTPVTEKTVTELLAKIREDGKINGEDLAELQALEQRFAMECSAATADAVAACNTFQGELKTAFETSLADGYTLANDDAFASLRIVLQMINPTYNIDNISGESFLALTKRESFETWTGGNDVSVTYNKENHQLYLHDSGWGTDSLGAINLVTGEYNPNETNGFDRRGNNNAFSGQSETLVASATALDAAIAKEREATPVTPPDPEMFANSEDAPDSSEVQDLLLTAEQTEKAQKWCEAKIDPASDVYNILYECIGDKCLVDNKYDVEAIAKVQKDIGVAIDGMPGKNTINLLTYHERQPNLRTPEAKADAQATIQAFCQANNIPDGDRVALITQAREFQKANGLTDDGKIGPRTLAKMKETFQPTPPTPEAVANTKPADAQPASSFAQDTADRGVRTNLFAVPNSTLPNFTNLGQYPYLNPLPGSPLAQNSQENGEWRGPPFKRPEDMPGDPLVASSDSAGGPPSAG